MARRPRIPLRAAATLTAVLAALRPLGAQQPAATVRGVVVAAESGERIPYAVVILEPGFSRRFADETGAFAFIGVAPGAVRLLVRQVGFTPFDSTINVSTASPTLRIELRHIAVELAGLTVLAAEACTAPGPPDPAGNPQLAALFEQLRQNAERYALLSDAYPFRYRLVRRITETPREGEERSISAPLDMRSDDRWHYAPGRVVTPDPDAPDVRIMHLPILQDLADSAFHRSHCFHLAGIDSVEGHPYIRLEFRAAASLRSQDIDGAAFLDPVTFQVRHTSVSLTRPGRGMVSLVANTAFKEIAPNIFIIDRVGALTTFDARPGARSIVGRFEEQKLLSVEFLRPLPAASDSTRRP